jgi:transcriptional regulator with XRE-family HTH domain
MDNVATNLALNVRHLRSARQLSQAQLAQIAGIPRPTLAHLESGSANPTLSVLMRLASALQVLIEELVAPPRSLVRHYSVEELHQRQRGTASIRQLLPDTIRGLTMERIELPAGAQLVGIPHARGTQEVLTCESGLLTIGVGGEETVLSAGDVVVFRADQRHSYRNTGAGITVCFSLVTSAPIPG